MNSALLLASLFAVLAPQDQDKPASQPQAPSADAAVKAWLESDYKDMSKREKAVAALINERRGGLDRLAAMMPKEAKELATPEKKGLNLLFQQYAYAFIVAQVRSNMIFEGQYAALTKLMPHAGDLCLRFVIDTPEWFHESLRRHAVSALRDIYVEKPPSEDALAKLKEIAKDEEFEKADLRAAVAQALWQWGDKELADKRLAALKKDVESGKDEEKLDAMNQLADYHYQLRDYATAAVVWKEWVSGTEKSKRQITPNDYYNAACSVSRSGDVDGAIAMLQAAVKLQLSGKVDKSRHVQKALFDHDPDLANARKDPRFAELVKEAFSSGGDEKKGAAPAQKPDDKQDAEKKSDAKKG